MNVCKFFLWDETATTAVEYAVMLAMILIMVIAAIGTFGDATAGMFGKTRTELEAY